jgi:hypothetical protein
MLLSNNAAIVGKDGFHWSRNRSMPLVHYVRRNDVRCRLQVYRNFLGVGVEVLLAADSQSTSKSGYGASLWEP